MSTVERGEPRMAGHFKDVILERLSERSNVAQFVSFSPGDEPEVRYVCLHGRESARPIASVEQAVAALLANSADRSVNVRAFDPHQPRSHEFVYGLMDVGAIAGAVRRLGAQGLYTIANETIDVGDGGVSGVAYGGVLEFAPADTPRCVEKPGIASFTRDLGLRVLETVYGFRPALDQPDEVRVEFSIHPLKRGVQHDHTILWEEEHTEPLTLSAKLSWPNRFSRFLGDKAFGLLVADAIGLPVPATTVVSRRVAPFTFGRPTGSGEYWIRTCPAEQVPGRFSTRHGWIDPFGLMTAEDPDGVLIASLIAQEGVDARYSGAAASSSGGDDIIEGVAGTGDQFMQGSVPPQQLPSKIVEDVRETLDLANQELGPARMEWVHDGSAVWVVQLHSGATATVGQVIYPGHPAVEHRFPVEHGLEALRDLVAGLDGTGEGIVLVGGVGVTSHLGDVLRRARIPSRIEAQPELT